MDWNGCLSTMQGYLENSPLIVLGSGASMPYGLPSMSSLAECITSSDIVKDDPNYDAFCESFSSEGLEKAIDSVSLNEATINAIRTITLLFPQIMIVSLRIYFVHLSNVLST